MVIAYHLIWTGYGWWLPNDPRGSGSYTVRNPVLRDLNELHYGRKRVQPAGRVIREFYEQAHPLLKHPVVSFDDDQMATIAGSFANVVGKSYTCYACALMPDHVHILIRKHKHQAEEIIEALKAQSRVDLHDSGLVPSDHPVWTSGVGWKVFLDTPAEICRTIRYINNNPRKAHRAAQSWPFVTPYDNWPYHKSRSAT